jgi:predicted dehydrogenase
MTQQTLRWGVIGTARIADELVRAWSLSKTNDLVAVASRNLDAAKTWAKQKGAAHAFGSYEAMLASNELDAVYIPLPNNLHVEWTVRAAQAGKHVLCEKPLADNAPDVEQVIAARDRSGVTIMEAFMYRFHPKTLKAKQLVDDGAVGDVRVIRATFGFFLRDLNNIRNQKHLAGGSLMDVGCYPVNLSRFMLDAEPIAVQAHAVWGASGVDHVFAGVLEFPGGRVALIDSSFLIEMHQWYGISGDKGHIGVTAPFRISEEPQVILYDHAGHHEDVHVPGANEYHMMIDHFAAAVASHSAPAYTLENSLGQARTIGALYQSARTGERVILA